MSQSRMVAHRIVVLLMVMAASATAADQPASNHLWQIGKPDNGYAEFALAPRDYGKFRDDAFFIVGQSDPKTAWPYVHPGPADPWAGSRSHTFTILFALKATPADGQCRLIVDLLDTHSRTAPVLFVDVNGKSFRHNTPAGGGDESIFGDPAKGREHRFEIAFPASLLKQGVNEISISNAWGSWALCDWVALQTPAGLELTEVKGSILKSAASPPVLIDRGGRLFQPIELQVRHVGDDASVTLHATGAEPVQASLRTGAHKLHIAVPAVSAETKVAVTLESAGSAIATRDVTLKPVRKWQVYLLPHSHVDIGYTHLQSDVEKLHWKHIENAIALSARTRDYPSEARFKWNVEVLWAVESYLNQATPEKRQAFIQAVKDGWIGLDGMYGNELTGLCRPEELLRLFRYGTKLADEIGAPIDSAMISDVPGCTWGIVTAMNQAGIKYFSVGTNESARIGTSLSTWGDKPFYWIGPDGKSRVLMWLAGRGYSHFHSGTLAAKADTVIPAYLRQLEEARYPYDMVQIRYSIGGDNGPPDPAMPDYVKKWNATYAYPKLVLATTSQLFREFENRYAAQIPSHAGDFTPYWEDGAASSAQETILNRRTADILTQAEALWAMLRPNQYPAGRFYDAWRDVILYDEHTWGAHNSISEPDAPFVKGQWATKSAFATRAAFSAAVLRMQALIPPLRSPDSPAAQWEVFNTTSFSQTSLVLVDVPTAGDAVVGPDGQPVPSHRLGPNALVFLAREVPPFSSVRYAFKAGPPLSGKVKVEGTTITNGLLTASIDPKTGAIASLKVAGIEADLADVKGDVRLNDYLYVPGADPKKAQRSGPVTIRLTGNNSLMGAIEIESDAPGCNKLTRIVRLVDGADHLDIDNIVDKKPIRTKEGVHFAFPFNVPDGVMRMETPFAVVRPEIDQLPGSCKNWFTVQRWVDVSNDQFGVTLATPDAPMGEVGAITAETPWIAKLAPSQTFYSYVMNNYWFTNYKADQEGPTYFRYAIRPHKGYIAHEAARFGIAFAQPLMSYRPTADNAMPSRLTIDNPAVIATLKPSDDRKALIVRLFAASEKPQRATIAFADPKPASISISDLSEKPIAPVRGPIELPPHGLVTIRTELP